MKKLSIYLFFICSGSLAAQNINRGKEYLTPANFNFPVRQQLWELTGDDPFVADKEEFHIELSYNYSSAEKFFDRDGNSNEIKMSFFQYNKGSDQGGYFRKHGAILTGQYHWAGLNKAVIRFPFTFTEMKSYSSTTDVKPQEEFIKPRGPFQDLELSYTRRIPLYNGFDLFGGAGLTIPTSRPKRYLDNPHGGYGNRWTNNLNLFASYKTGDFRFTTGGKYVIVYPVTEELFTPRPYGIGYPYLYDTVSISPEEMNSFIEQNEYSSRISTASLFFYDLVADYFTSFGLDITLQFQYFNSSGDSFESQVPVLFVKENGSIVPAEFISSLEGGNSGSLRFYLQQNLGARGKSSFGFILGYGVSVFGNNSQQEANLILGMTGRF